MTTSQTRYPLMSDPYILYPEFEGGIMGSIDSLVDIMDFDQAIQVARDVFQLTKGALPKLECIHITCHDRTAVIVFNDLKLFWPDLTDPTKGGMN